MTAQLLKLAAAALLGGASLSAAASPDLPTSRRHAVEQWRAEGLQQRDVHGLDVVFVRPEERRGFNIVVLRPPSISFSRHWERSATLGSRIRALDADRIRDSFARIIQEEVSRELAQSGYKVVDHPAGDAVELDVSIIELYVNSPDLPTSARTQTYAVSAASMTLVAELRESASGHSLARVYDHDPGREFGPIVRMTRGESLFEARQTARTWAIALRRQLDVARGTGRPL